MPGKSLQVGFDGSPAETAALMRALANETRIAILRYLGDQIVPVNEIAHDLGLPQSTATMHVGLLEKAGLIQTELQPARRGLQKICGRRYDELVISLPVSGKAPAPAAVLSTAVGAYTDFHVEPSCGLASPTSIIGLLDDPQSFWEPGRIEAQLLWFRAGFVEYVFPNHVPAGVTITALQFSAELCSEAPLSDPDWPSDITVWVNRVALGSWTSPADFGEPRGLLNPAWWGDRDSQYGLLKRWRVTEDGTTIDGVPLSDVRLSELGVRARQPIRLRIGVAAEAENVGGVNLFGRGFGNYPQDLELRLEYQ
ncbi:MAG TPA: helix-turn-helix domain-containing protein [Candidatus Limnocylindrales bacterium]